MRSSHLLGRGSKENRQDSPRTEKIPVPNHDALASVTAEENLLRGRIARSRTRRAIRGCFRLALLRVVVISHEPRVDETRGS